MIIKNLKTTKSNVANENKTPKYYVSRKWNNYLGKQKTAEVLKKVSHMKVQTFIS